MFLTLLSLNDPVTMTSSITAQLVPLLILSVYYITLKVTFKTIDN